MAKRRTPAGDASGNGHTTHPCPESISKTRVDRRVQKTRKSLHAALAALIPEKPYDAITVKDILDRADVGRSTFYTHFGDKDDLLVWGIQDMLGSVHVPAMRLRTRRERVTWFSLPLFKHIYEHRRTAQVNTDVKARAIVHERLQTVVSEVIADTVRREFRSTRRSVSPDLIVRYVASTFIIVLNWWLENGNPLAPKDAEDLFQALVAPALEKI